MSNQATLSELLRLETEIQAEFDRAGIDWDFSMVSQRIAERTGMSTAEINDILGRYWDSQRGTGV